MTQPLIGITASRTYNQAGNPVISVNEAYTHAVARSGAAPLTIPLGLPDEMLNELLSRLDGVLFSGGGDVETSRYHGIDHPCVSDVDTDRDRIEILLSLQVIQRGIPFLGICRGIQVINVALGGTLYSDIADQHAGALRHDFYPDFPRDHPAHTVEIAAGSRLAQILDVTHIATNSLHHQAVQQLAPGLHALAHASDGIVEAVEYVGHPFGLAVQWHPEWMPDSLPMQALFRAFTAAASRPKGTA
jgi:putative glutamine amidotransferase